MIILNDSFRRVNAIGGRVGGVHELYPDAGRLVKVGDFNSELNFISKTLDPIVGLGVIRSAVNDIGNGLAGGWLDLEYDWESGISKWEVKSINITIEVESKSQFVRQPNILFDIESSVTGYREIFGFSDTNISISSQLAYEIFNNWVTADEKWDELNAEIKWMLFPPQTLTSSVSSLISVYSSSSFFKDQLIKRTASFLLEVNSLPVTTQIDAFGDWANTVNEWQDLGGTLWEVYTSQTHTDTTSATIIVSSNSSFLIDKLIKRTANIAIGLNSNSTFFIDKIISSGANASLGITATVTPQVISFGSWALTNTNWESTNNIWEIYSSDIDIDTASSSISISTIARGYIDTIYSRTASANITVSASSSSDSDTIFTRSGVTSISIGATATKTIILGWGTSTVLWSNYTTNWEAN